jgi:hypothetical protein
MSKHRNRKKGMRLEREYAIWVQLIDEKAQPKHST